MIDPALARESRPRTPAELWAFVLAYFGVRVARRRVCVGHHAPWESFRDLFLDRPPIALVLGPRGGGKSFLSGLGTHLDSRFHPRHGTRILGGSKAQSEQVYRAVRDLALDGRGPLGDDRGAIEVLNKTSARYRNGSEVEILAASSTSVRGPHIPTLKLDEVDEIDPELRESAMGMCMAKAGCAASVAMTSTWHRVGGPMSGLIERARAGEFPLYQFCMFEVLERCPESRSGPAMERCPECPLFRWCHADRMADPTRPPKAKLSSGHYAIDALIQKVRTVSLKAFEADYLCLGPKSDGLWFATFSRSIHASAAAEFDPSLPVHLSIDSGVFTGAVWFQVRKRPDGTDRVAVFGDYLAEGGTAEGHARAIVARGLEICNGRRDVVSTDPAGGSRNAIGPTVVAEYCRGGLCDERTLRRWPVGPVADALALVEAFVAPASGGAGLLVHPRCEATLRALEGYRRARRGGQWQDYPEDPQHPAEDLVDALKGGLKVAFPEGRKPGPNMRRVAAGKVF